MNKMLKIGVLCIVFLLCDCQVQAQKIETKQNNAIQYERTKKAEIVSAFSFWINKNCWLYGSSEYADIQNKIKIYYKNKNAKDLTVPCILTAAFIIHTEETARVTTVAHSTKIPQ